MRRVDLHSCLQLAGTTLILVLDWVMSRTITPCSGSPCSRREVRFPTLLRLLSVHLLPISIRARPPYPHPWTAASALHL